jgi:hypothetical protein
MSQTPGGKFVYIDGPVGGVDGNSNTLLKKLQTFQIAVEDEIEAIVAAGLPDQTGHAGEFLTTDGSSASWADPTLGGMNNPMTTIGDIIVGGTAGAPERFGAGTGWLHNNGSGTFAWSTPSKSDVGLGNVSNDAQLKIASNLSDLNNAATARTNLGVAIGTNVQAWDGDLDAIAAIAATSGLLRKTAANTWSLDTNNYVPADITLFAGDGLTGGGDLSQNRTFNVGAGTLITVGADSVGITPGAADYGYIGSTTTPWTATWRSISTLAGNGLTHATGVLAVGAGTLITVGSDSVGITPGASDYGYIGSTTTPWTASWISLSTLAGDGLTHTTGVLAVGAGTLVTVSANAVGITPGASDYGYIGSTTTPWTATWIGLSTLAGNGLTHTTGVLAVGAGDGLTVGNDAVALTQPGQLTVSSANLSNGTGDGHHTHAITSNSNPGATASIVATDADGHLQLAGLGIGVHPSQPLTVSGNLFVNDTTGNLFLYNITTGFNATPNVVQLLASNRLQGAGYVSQTTSWGIDSAGAADFRYIYADELHAKSFIADLEQALAGGQIISKSVAEIASDFTLPVAGGSATLTVKDLPSAAGMAVFQENDFVRLRQFYRTVTEGELTIRDAWGVVTSHVDNEDGTQSWTFARSSGSDGGDAGGTANFLSAITPGSVRNNYSGWVGFKFSTGSKTPTITALGRWRVSGNTGTHLVRLYKSDNTQIASVSIDMSSGTAGEIKWASITPVTLLSGTSYYVLSQELDTGDQWYQDDTTVTGNSDAGTLWGSAYTSDPSVSFTDNTSGGYSFVPVSFQFTSGGTISAKTLALDYGQSGNGFYEVNAIDGLYGVNSPYAQIVTWTSHPKSGAVLRTRFGNLKGITGTTNEFGLLAGTYAASNGAFFRASNSAFDLHGITAKWWDATTNVVVIAPNSGSPYIGIGNPAPATLGTAGVFLGWDHADLKAKASFYATSNSYLQYDGTKLWWKAANTELSETGILSAYGGVFGTVNGSGARVEFNSTGIHGFDATTERVRILNDGSGYLGASNTLSWTTAGVVTIAGWTVNTAALVKENGANSAGMAPADYPFYGGATYANRATAPFHVSSAGVLTAYGATIGTASGTGARVVLDSTGIKSYDATTQRVAILNDGSGYLGASNTLSWTTAGVVTVAGWTLSSSRIYSTHVYLDNTGEYLSFGNPPPTAYGTSTGIFIGKDGSAYKAQMSSFQAPFQVTATNVTNGTFSGGVFTKTNADGWNAGYFSVEALGANVDGYITWTQPNETTAYRSLGLSTDDPNQSWDTVEYAFYFPGTSTIQIYENGTQRVSFAGVAVANTTVYKIERVGSEIRYYVNGVNQHTTTGASTAALYVDNALYTYNTTIPQITMARYIIGAGFTWSGSALTLIGSVTATSGAIGGWTLGDNYLIAGSGSNRVGIDSGGTNPAFYAGSDTPGSAPFRVTKAGLLTATNVSITAGGGNVTLDSNGLAITAGGDSGNKVQWKDSGTGVGDIYANYGSVGTDAAQTVIRAVNKAGGSTAASAWVGIYAYNGAGSAVSILLERAGASGANKGYVYIADAAWGGLAVGHGNTPVGSLDVRNGGLTLNNPTGGDKGSGTINAAGAYWANGTTGVSAGSFSTITAITSTNGLVTQLTGSSDVRLKNIDGPFTRGLSDLLKINPVRFHWNDFFREHWSQKTNPELFGVTAQNMEYAIPESVSVERWSDDSEWLSVNKDALIMTLVNSVKELSAELVALKARLQPQT